MEFAVTVVNAPDGISAARWSVLLQRAPGQTAHELRFTVAADYCSISGAMLHETLIQELTAGESLSPLSLRTAGRPLREIGSGSPWIRPGMVILATVQSHRPMGLREHGLGLMIDAGPDSGRLVSLGRGSYGVGRGQADIRIADPYISRSHSRLDVAAEGVTTTASKGSSPTLLSADDTMSWGTSEVRLASSSVSVAAPTSWPPEPAPLSRPAPQGRHRLMLAMACVPLAVGIILVLVTGMWFFLLFSMASALIAGGMVWQGFRERRRYRAAVRFCAQQWAQRAADSLPSPGMTAASIRSADIGGRLPAGATLLSEEPEDSSSIPVLRVGRGTLSAETVPAPDDVSPIRDREVFTPVGLALRPGEVTRLSGPVHLIDSLQRWLLVQLATHPLQPSVHILQTSQSSEDRILTEASLRDQPRLRAGRNLKATENEQCPDVIFTDTALPEEQLREMLSMGTHVVCRDRPEFAQLHGWSLDLDTGILDHIDTSVRTHVASGLIADGVSARTATHLLRRSIHLLPPSDASSAPKQCRLPVDEPMMTATLRESLRCDCGMSTNGRVSLDLVEDGPHLLIAGTTGSGKSELLKTLLISAAARYGPDELNMVLFDFKGGAAFQELATLEHTLNLVTDLSQAQAERTLEGIRSEMRRREELFLAEGTADYGEYRMLRPDRPLARIVVVIDEFRILAHEMESSLDELMRLATLGRSLGLHLILATQRPQGIVTADIRANINSTICLRVRRDEESQDLLGTSQAARISRQLPGRAFLRRASEEPIEFQTAQLNSPRVRPRAYPEHNPPHQRLSLSVAGPLPEMKRLIQHKKLRRSHTPLLPALPSSLTFSDQQIDIGLIDAPGDQEQRMMSHLHDREQNIAFIGEPSAGGPTTLRAVGAQALAQSPTMPVYLLDGDGSLSDLSSASGIGAWLGPDALAEARYLLSELTARTELPTGNTQHLEPALLLVSGWGQWQAAERSGTTPIMEHQLGVLAAQGQRRGLSVMISGSRELAIGKLTSRFSHRIYLPYAASEEERYLWPPLRTTDLLPGRGVLLTPDIPAPGLAVQLVDSAPSMAEVAERETPALSVHTLPEHLRASELPSPTLDPSAPGITTTVGQHQFTAEWAQFSSDPVSLILGSPGTGKSSCLRLLAQRFLGAQLVSGTGNTESWHTLSPASGPVLIDDAHQADAEQHQILQRLIEQGRHVIATAPAQGNVFSLLPWAHAARSGSSNVLLSPTHRSEGDIFALSVPLLKHRIPGRAVHLRPDGPRIVQWAMPES